ncbi:Hypothetical protein NocV09_08300060, partial [Nannochloropsis oceanica]
PIVRMVARCTTVGREGGREGGRSGCTCETPPVELPFLGLLSHAHSYSFLCGEEGQHPSGPYFFDPSLHPSFYPPFASEEEAYMCTMQPEGYYIEALPPPPGPLASMPPPPPPYLYPHQPVVLHDGYPYPYNPYWTMTGVSYPMRASPLPSTSFLPPFPALPSPGKSERGPETEGWREGGGEGAADPSAW